MSQTVLYLEMPKFFGSSEQYILQNLLKRYRASAELKQTELADLLGQSQSFVSKYESGERRLDLIELWKICQALNVPLSEFVSEFEQLLNESK
jgi:transcriptional regulator with XRE-family HTH domain